MEDNPISRAETQYLQLSQELEKTHHDLNISRRRFLIAAALGIAGGGSVVSGVTERRDEDISQNTPLDNIITGIKIVGGGVLLGLGALSAGVFSAEIDENKDNIAIFRHRLECLGRKIKEEKTPIEQTTISSQTED